jgi:hypothetical protein
VNDPAQAEHWLESSRLVLDCIVAGIAQIDEEARMPCKSDAKSAGSVNDGCSSIVDAADT